jgi:hypothetical protein
LLRSLWVFLSLRTFFLSKGVNSFAAYRLDSRPTPTLDARILPRQFARVGHPLLGLRDGEALPFGEVAQGKASD